MRSASVRTMVRAIVLCCLAFAAVPRPLAAPRTARPPAPQVAANALERRYFDILAAYERGADGEAAATLSTWSEGDVRKVVNGLIGRAVTMTGSGTRELAAHAKAAAILLHTQVAMTLVRDAANADVEPPGAGLHFAMAQLLLVVTRTPLPDLDPRFAGFTVRDWSLAVIRWLTRQHAFVLARQVTRVSGGGRTRRLENLFAEDAEVWLGIGIMEEAASIFEGLESDTQASGWWDRARHSRQARDAQQRAEQLYRGALQRQPALAEARLRLARLLLCRGESAEASSQLRQLLEAPAAPRIEYLGNLFLGRLHQQAGRLDEAIACYGKAVAQYPSCQVARLALADGLAQHGDVELSAEALGELSSRRREVDWAMDPWWAYPDGPYEEAVDYLKRLHDRGLGR